MPHHELDDNTERIAELFERTARAMMWAVKPRQIKPLAFDLTVAQNRCLWAIARRENCTLRELSQHLEVSPSTACELVDRLVRAELVQREGDAQDRRAIRLRLSKKGQRHLDQQRAERREHLRAFLDRLAPPQRQAMLSALETLNDVLEQATPEKEESGKTGEKE
ncbi:MAG: MarR family transcriptional regulator [Armatimonadota bacterium]|nr:MarR family transcriptional regulator [Armatimonadota bacterium]